MFAPRLQTMAPIAPYRSLTLVLTLTLILALAGCSAQHYRQQADDQVYGILEAAARSVSSQSKTFPLERPVDNLRQQLLSSDDEVLLDLQNTLDVAAENSRGFQDQKESLYRTALSLTLAQHDFALRFSGGGAGDIDGVDDDSMDVSLSDDLSASMNTESGGRLVASFANTFLQSLVSGGGWDPSSLLSLTFTQPLLRGAGKRIVREPLTQAERDVIYAMRSFERFRRSFSVDIVSDYYGLLSQVNDLINLHNNYDSVSEDVRLTEDLVAAGRRSKENLAQARQNQLQAENRIVTARARLQSSMDRFKVRLGLPTDGNLQLDEQEFDRISTLGVNWEGLTEVQAMQLAMARRLDYRTVLDQVADAGRQVLVAEDALDSILDFSSAIEVPTEPGKAMKFDWDKVSWAAGFNLDLALDRLAERNAYRSALINLDAAIRNREALEDQIKSEVRQALRDLLTTAKSHEIQTMAVEVARARVQRTEAFLAAGGRDNIQQRDLLEAKDALLAAQLSQTQALVDFTTARLRLLRDLEALIMEPKGLRFDPGLPLPEVATMTGLPKEPNEHSH